MGRIGCASGRIVMHHHQAAVRGTLHIQFHKIGAATPGTLKGQARVFRRQRTRPTVCSDQRPVRELVKKHPDFLCR